MVAPFRAWPYAALAVVNWLYETPSLFCWVVFRHPMDQSVKPPLATWVVDVDGVEKTPASSAWIDEWTLLLTVTLDGVKPDIVYVEYEGPDENLRTTWMKQWEPWGPILATSFQVIPQNIIVMFHGAIVDIPQGWTLCDGTNGTPDLTDLFIVGAGNSYNPGDTGGSATQTHTFTTNGHFHDIPQTPPNDAAAGFVRGARTDTKTDSGTTDSSDNRPPFYALAFIMKV